jgi:hypothetical protein
MLPGRISARELMVTDMVLDAEIAGCDWAIARIGMSAIRRAARFPGPVLAGALATNPATSTSTCALS